jgi:hypothetical protein
LLNVVIVETNKMNIKNKLKSVWYVIETRFTKLQLLFGITKDESVIPNGMYCYEIDKERNLTEPTAGVWIKTCKYYRGLSNRGGIACTYVGFYGFDSSLYDRCKICAIKEKCK